MTGEIATLAANLARNCGWPVLPCRNDKRPASPHGFKDATNDRGAIARLWSAHPGPLIGVATGEASDVDVLDIDVKHDPGLAWWQANWPRMPATRAFRTRSGGIHLYLRHAVGVCCSAGKLAPGVDVRGDGGYAIFWFAAGLECLDHTPVAEWPAWLLAELLPKPRLALRPFRSVPLNRNERTIDGLLRLVECAAEGSRNATLHWAACRLGERVLAGQIGAGEAEALLLAAALAAGLTEREGRATVRSGLRSAA